MLPYKARVIIDSTILGDSLLKDISRTGIYFTAYNIFNNIYTRDDLDIILYTERAQRLKRYLRRYFPACVNFSIIRKLNKGKAVGAFFSAGDPANESVSYSIPGISCYSILYDISPIIHPEYFNISQAPAMWEMLNNFSTTDHYFAISESTKNDVIRMGANIDPNRISVIPLGANEHFYQNNDADVFEAVRKKYKIPGDKRYILSLCTKEPRKNLITAIKAFIEFIKKNNIDDLVYVLAGGVWNIFKEDLKKCLDDLGQYSDKIISIGYADDEDVASLYSNAQWFVYTSHYEGFGLPPLEAMQCGCPVVTSNSSSLPEVVGDAAIMVDSHDISQHVKAYEEYYINPTLRQENSRKGLERAKLFSWKRCADIICNRIIADAKKKQNHPHVSIVIVANCAESSEDFAVIRRRIESVHTQRYDNKELLVMDCGADSSVSERLRAYSAESGVILKAATGMAACKAFNDALETVGGKYLAFLSPGMYFVNDEYIAVCVAKSEEFDADLSYADCDWATDDSNDIWRGDIAKIPFGEHFSGGSVFVKRDTLTQAGAFSTEYGAAAFDEMIMRMARDKKNIVHIHAMKTGLDAASYPKQYANEYAKAYYDVFGKDLGISLSEALDLYSGNYLKCYPDHEVFKLAAKLPVHMGGMALCERLFKSRHAARFVDDERRAELAGSRHLLFGFLPLAVKYNGTAIRNEVTYYLPGGIPILKIKRRERCRASYYLFNFLPLFRTKNKS